MSLMLHIVAKDLRRLRWPLAIWFGLLLAKYAIGFILIWGGKISGDVFKHLEIPTLVISMVEVVLVFLLTARLVQGDRVEGTRQFWLTRPISSGRMLGAKLLGVLLLLVAPALGLALPWWLACGFDLPWIAAAAVELLTWQLLAIFPAFLVASLTDTIGRFLVWSLVLAWLAAMAPIYTQMAWARASGARDLGTGFSSEQIFVAVVVMALVFAGVVVLQYQVRRWQRSVAVLAVGGLFALGTGTLWVGERAAGRGRPAPEEWNAAKGADVKLAWKEARVDKSSAPSFENGAGIKGYLMAIGIPDGLALYGKGGEFTWQLPGGLRYEKSGRLESSAESRRAIRAIYSLPEPRRDEETEAWLRAHPPKPRRGVPASPPPEPEANLFASTRLPLSLVARTQREPAKLELGADLELRRPVVAVTVPLRQGGWRAGGGTGLRVMEIKPVYMDSGRPDSGRVSESQVVTLVQSYPQLLGEPANWVIRLLTTRDVRYWWWWHADRRIVVHPHYGVGRSNYHRTSPAVQISSVALRSEVIGAGVYSVVREGKWVRPQPDWFEGAEIAILDWVPVARFTRNVVVENVVIAK